MSRVFSSFFSKAIEGLKISNISNITHNRSNDSLKEELNSFKNQSSILNIKRKGFDKSFTFRETNTNKVIKLIKTLNINKACQNRDIPTKIIKSNADLFANYIFGNFNYCLERDEIPCVLKYVGNVSTIVRSF